MGYLDQQIWIGFIILLVSTSVIIYIYANRPLSSGMKPILIQGIPPSTSISTSTSTSTPAPVKQVDRVLVMYVWANIDVQSLGNLEFFVRYGISESQPADYYFILQNIDNKPVNESALPVLPSNGHYIQHINECYDIGTMGWFLSQNITNTTAYKYFVFMNSSIRGPFFVPYFEYIGMTWFHIFTNRLNDKIKLIGPSINCEQRPHVQSYLMVTDQVGLALLSVKEAGIFRCHANYHDAVFDGEIAASQLLLRANYQIASLQSKYQGWDFSKPENQGCNYGASPIYYDRAFDTISHDPYELIFVKFKGQPPFDTDLERRALVYQKWLDERPRPPKKIQ